MGCGSSSLKGSDDVGTANQPTVPNNNPLQPSSAGNPLKKTATNFSTVDYDAETKNKKAAMSNAQAPDEIDEGPERQMSGVSPTATKAEPVAAEVKEAEKKEEGELVSDAPTKTPDLVQ